MPIIMGNLITIGRPNLRECVVVQKSLRYCLGPELDEVQVSPTIRTYDRGYCFQDEDRNFTGTFEIARLELDEESNREKPD